MGLRRLLGTTDFSGRSDLAVKRAASLCRQFDAELQLLHIVDDAQPADIVEHESRQATSLLQTIAAGVENELGKKPICIVKAGDPFQEIVQIATDNDANLIVMGSHRRRILRDFFVGTTIEWVMCTGHHPVLMVNTEPKGSYRRIVVASDMSETSANALVSAKSLGLLDDANVSLVHAFEPLAKGRMIFAKPERRKIEQHAGDEASEVRRKLTDFLAELPLGEMQYDLRVIEGPTFPTIKEFVDNAQPDLLVIGTRGLTGVKRILLGSVADAVLRGVKCDILAVPPRPE
jgi:universal stress protein E